MAHKLNKMLFFYRLSLILLLPFFILKLAIKAGKNPNYRQRIGERFGIYRKKKFNQKGVCIHAVSVGEVNAASGLIHHILKNYPKIPITVTCMTPTGSARIKAIFGEQVQHIYLPYDYGFAMRRFFDKLQPCLLVVMETEIWPTMLQQCQCTKIPVLYSNVRLSERSYKRYLRFKALTRFLFQEVSHFMVQTEQDANRIIALGAPANCVSVCGNLKFDQTASMRAIQVGGQIRQAIGDRVTLVAASTRDGEDEKVLSAFIKIQQQIPNALMILVPRHPERAPKIRELIAKRQINFIQYSDTQWMQQQEIDSSIRLSRQVDVILVDAIGVLSQFYVAADVAFVGGSLVDTGCQNVLEPCLYELPVLFGPSVYNFVEATNLLLQANAAIQVADSDDLAKRVIELINESHLVDTITKNATQVIKQNKGALNKQLKIIQPFLDQ